VNPEIERLLELAAQVPSEARPEVLARECSTPGARDEVWDLLRYAEEAECCFDHAIQGVASSLITGLEPQPGDVIGSYRIVKPIGQGGMGRVYLAERADGEIEQKVAIKLLRAGGLGMRWRERFLKERQLLASLHHPSIVHVIDAGHTEDGRPFLIMEHVDGVPIDHYAAGIGVRELLKLFGQVCEGVSHAHRHLIIHRDLKPSNILVDAMGRPKLLDFGIAKLLNDTGDATQVPEQLLTPNYASPEQLRGEAQSTATDIYSLATVLYKLLTGAAPRESGRSGVSGEAVPPSQVNPGSPEDLDIVVGKALRPEPEERYGSVDDFAGDIRAVLEGRPVQARGNDVWYRTRRYLRRYWMPVTAVFVVMMSLSAGLWMVNRERRIADRERAIAEQRFTDVRQLADRLFDIDVQVAQLPGGSRTRQLIVDTALEYLRRVSADARMEPGLALELGNAYMRVARVQGVNISPNLGQTAQADQTAQTAQALIDSVLAQQPGNRIALLRAGQIAHDRMLLAAAAGRQDQVLRFAGTSVDRLDQFLATRPLNASSDHMDAQQVIIGLMNAANHYMKAGRFDEAIRIAQRANSLAHATNWPAQAGAALMIVALSHRAAGELEQALQAIRESVRLLEPEPGETRVGRLQPYGLALIREGQILGEDQAISLSRPEEAIAFLEQGRRIGWDFARRDEGDFGSQHRVFFADTRLAGILRHSDAARASALYDEALGRLAAVAANGSAARDEAETLAASVYPLLQLGRRDEARKRLDGALERLRQLDQYPARQIELGSPADYTLRALAEYEAACGHVRDGAARYEELLRLVEAAGSEAETSLEDAVTLSELYGAASRLERRAGRTNPAARLEAQRLRLWQDWDAKLPGSIFVHRRLRTAQAR
jgi:tetratricopeptide (TPR) repeat protein/tRNA A-37 threonylcarbamoyl transferase component Bud32